MKSIKKRKKKQKTTATLVLFRFYREKYGPKHGNKDSPLTKQSKTAVLENRPIMQCELRID